MEVVGLDLNMEDIPVKSGMATVNLATGEVYITISEIDPSYRELLLEQATEQVEDKKADDAWQQKKDTYLKEKYGA